MNTKFRQEFQHYEIALIVLWALSSRKERGVYYPHGYIPGQLCDTTIAVYVDMRNTFSWIETISVREAFPSVGPKH